MAAEIIEISDFKNGKYKIGTDCFSKIDLQSYIDKYERFYLDELLGCVLADLFITDLVNGVPQAAIFTVIFDPICEDDGCVIRRSEGIKEMLKGFIYWEYARDINTTVRSTGNKKTKSENSAVSPFNVFDIYNRYNLSIGSLETIQWFIKRNETDDYPDFNGQPLKRAHWT